MLKKLFPVAVGLLLASAGFGAEPAGREPRQVFAHYMVCYSSSVEFYDQEIELAQRHGIDGFALNCGQWLVKDTKTGELNPSNYVLAAERIYEAARRRNSGFKLFLSADVNGLPDLPENMDDMVRRFAAHPNQVRVAGKPVLSAWAGQPVTYAAALAKIQANGRPVCFIPFVYNAHYAMAWSFETVLNFFKDQPHMDGLFFFAADDTVAGLLRGNAITRRATQYLGKLSLAGVAPAMNSPNLRDFHGVEGYGALWEGIIRDGHDFVEIVTWNDYNEDTNLMPFRWPAGAQRQFFDRDETFLDATAYYSAWFKAGRAPAITQDKVYVTYRTRTRWQRKLWDSQAGTWKDLTAKAWPYDQIHDDVEDNVYLTAFLTAPAVLTVKLGAATQTFALPAGIAHATVPLAPGTPHFQLQRNGQTLTDFSGRREIITVETPENSAEPPNMQHLLNRTWTSAAAVGKPIGLESDKLGQFAVPAGALTTATYCVRVQYRNPTAREARWTLSADGLPRTATEFPYFIPVYLPPTGRAATGSVAFFWSLYDRTTHLNLTQRTGAPDRLDDDYGDATVESVELIKVEPVATVPPQPADVPELVPIPGGTFTMGRDAGRPDERPAHSVTVAPFTIGRFEVTNAEFERFQPEHRQFRDGFSWRDREPVIYVSWLDAAKYCNWLSAQSGLQPVYDSKTWQADLTANGFRLPTEAEWEYAASGRGDGRLHPWGPEAADHSRGNFDGATALAIDPRLRSNDDGGGVTVVGSFPRGASRDGILDLAGNVAEWCTDWLQPYSAEAQTNPCVQQPSNYRVIRGGSWGYYGFSQQCTQREFNNPNYGGYIYIGFRVALPDAGWRKLTTRSGHP